jgi:hypothetical protein
VTLHVRQDGVFLRVVDPDWADPLDPTYAARRGGRWNPPGTFGVVYLCADRTVARANVLRLFADLPYGPEDLDPDRAPQLVEVDVEPSRYVDAVSDPGLRSLGLPTSYPLDETGAVVAHDRCQLIGARLHREGEPGIAARSAAPAAGGGSELAWFAAPGRQPLQPIARLAFTEWFW